MTLRSRRGLLALGAAGIAGVATGVVSASPATVAAAQPTAADIGFCQDMSAHHVQALAMCQRVLGRDTGDPVQAAAAEVLQNQAIEVGQMRAWLTDWGASTARPEVVMAWMVEHDGVCMSLDAMPGYATDAELQELSRLTGDAQGRRWLELMRAHHVGGVTMANSAARVARSEKVVRLAAAQVAVQTYEIGQYDLLLHDEFSDV